MPVGVAVPGLRFFGRVSLGLFLVDSLNSTAEDLDSGIVVDLQRDPLIVGRNFHDRSNDPPGCDDLVVLLQRRQHFRPATLFLLLGPQQDKVEDEHHHDDGKISEQR